MRNELKIGTCLFVVFGLGNVLFNTPEFILGFLGSLSVVLVLIGSMKDESYQKLKKFKNSFRKERL